MGVQGLAQQAVQRRRGQPQAARLVDPIGRFQHLVDSLSRQGADEQHRRLGQEVELVAHGIQPGGHGVRILCQGVPLVDDDDHAATRFQNRAGDMLVLLRDAVKGIDHQQGDVRPLDGPNGAQHAVFLHAPLYLAAAPHAGGVDQGQGRAMPENVRVNGVAGGTGKGADNGALLAQQTIEQAALADVGAPRDGDFEHIVVIVVFPRRCARAHRRDNRVQQVPDP